ncbi:MAG TPA: hypothetical protein VFA59_07455 [Vicinamibacterales bacterium]|nr:hypothetical protein [Vicinamibacterales bacterium]
MRRMLLGALVVSVTACSSVAPVKVESGEVCFRCRRVIADSRMAAESIDHSLVSKFKTSYCLAKYLGQHPDDKSVLFVTDYTTGKLISADRARFVPIVNRDNGEREYIAYTDRAIADAEAFAKGTRAVGWADVLSDGREWVRKTSTGD